MSDITSETIKEFFEKVKDLDYVVQRNFEELPKSLGVEGHEDLDVLVSDEDVDAFYIHLASYPTIQRITDVRTPSDGYYPKELAHFMLAERVDVMGIHVPSPIATFLGLYYHDNVHKEHPVYAEKLRELFLIAFPPTKPADEGVGFFL